MIGKYILAAAIALISLSTCIDKECRDTQGYYEFVLPTRITPNQEVYRVGDTMTVSITFADEVLDRTTQRTYLLEDYDFDPYAILMRIDTTPVEDGFLHCSEILNVDAEEYLLNPHSDGSSNLLYRFNYENSTYWASFTFRLDKPGLYVLFTGSQVILSDPHQQFPGKCRNRGANPVFIVTEPANGDHGYGLLDSSPEEWIRETSRAKFESSGGFAFVVEE